MNFEFVRHICAHGNELPAGPPPFYTGPRGSRSGMQSIANWKTNAYVIYSAHARLKW